MSTILILEIVNGQQTLWNSWHPKDETNTTLDTLLSREQMHIIQHNLGKLSYWVGGSANTRVSISAESLGRSLHNIRSVLQDGYNEHVMIFQLDMSQDIVEPRQVWVKGEGVVRAESVIRRHPSGSEEALLAAAVVVKAMQIQLATCSCSVCETILDRRSIPFVLRLYKESEYACNQTEMWSSTGV
jgi:hypothetical protein